MHIDGVRLALIRDQKKYCLSKEIFICSNILQLGPRGRCCTVML